MKDFGSKGLVFIEKQYLPNETIFHENIIDRFELNERKCKETKLKIAFFSLTWALVVGAGWSAYSGSDLYTCVGIATVMVIGLWMVWGVIRLAISWQFLLFMGFRVAHALKLTWRNESNIAKYYTDLLSTDAIKKYLATEEIGQLTDIRITTDTSNNGGNTPSIKKQGVEVLVVGDIDYGSHSRTISATLEFNNDNSQLTLCNYEISAITEYDQTK